MKVNHFIPHALSLGREGKFPPTPIFGGRVIVAEFALWTDWPEPCYAAQTDLNTTALPALASKVVDYRYE